MNSFYNILGRAITTVIQLVYIPLLFNTLGERDYGLYAITFIIFTNIQLLDFGIGKATIRLMSIYNRIEQQKFFYSILFFVLAIFLGVSMISILFFNVFKSSFNNNEVYLISIIWGLLEIIKVFFIGVKLFFEKFLEFNIVIVVSEILKFTLVVLMNFYGFGLFELLIGFCIISLLQTLYYLIRFKFYFLMPFKRGYLSVKFILENFQVYKDLTLSNLIFKTNFTIDKLAVWMIGSQEILARYYLAMQVISKASEFPQNVMIGFNSKIAIHSNRQNKSSDSALIFIKKSLVYSLLIIFSGTIFFELIGDFLLPLVLNEYNNDISNYISLLLYTLPFGVVTMQITNVLNMAGNLIKMIHIQIIQISLVIIGIIIIGNKLNVENLIYLFIITNFLVSLFASVKLINWNIHLKGFLLIIYCLILIFQLCLHSLTS